MWANEAARSRKTKKEGAFQENDDKKHDTNQLISQSVKDKKTTGEENHWKEIDEGVIALLW